MSVKEAAVRYDVSRAKLHRLIQLGRLHTERDPRDERVTLLRADELESLFRFPSEDVGEMSDGTDTVETAGLDGRLTEALRSKADALRSRVAGGLNPASGSVAILREERDRRGERLEGAVVGKDATHEYQK